MRRLDKFIKLPAADQRLILEAVILLGIARLAIMTIAFKRIAPYLGVHMAITPKIADAAHDDLIGRVRWAVAIAARHGPWSALCLPQAVAAQIMLARRGIASTLYLGVARADGLKAHAWLRAGNAIVTGQGDLKQYTIVSTFAR